MRKIWCVGFVLILLCSTVAFSSRAGGAGVSGVYVEVRTASVFAGACHYNGELVTTGREAMMAWDIKAGQWRGVDLAGVRALAVVSSASNLATPRAARRSELVIDAGASEAQASAAAEAIRSRYAAALGDVVSVRRAPVSFEHREKTYSVNAADLAAITVEAMPNDDCCKMPHLVWYSPLVPLAERKVGYTKQALFAGGATGDAWQRAHENSAFYGRFSF